MGAVVLERGSHTAGLPIAEIVLWGRARAACRRLSVSGKGLAKGEWRLSPASKAYDPRIGYALAFPFTIGLVGSLINYVRSGEWPQDWRDFFLPKTGGEVRSRSSSRLGSNN